MGFGDSFKKFTQSVKEKTGMAEPTKDPHEVQDAASGLKTIARELNDLHTAAKKYYSRELDSIEGLKSFASVSLGTSNDSSMTNVREHLPAMLTATANARSEALTHFKTDFLDVLYRFIDNEVRATEKALKKNADSRLDYDAKASDYHRLSTSTSAKDYEVEGARRKMEDAEQVYQSAGRDFLAQYEEMQEKKKALFRTNISSYAAYVARTSDTIRDAAQTLENRCA